MENEQRQRRGASLLFLAFFTACLGTCGACEGAFQLQGDRYLVAAPDASPEEADAQLEVAALLASNPNRSALAASRIVVSLLLVWGGFMLMRRHANALWWARNAAVAGALWVVAQTLSAYRHRLLIADDLATAAALLPDSPQVKSTWPLLNGAIVLVVYIYLLVRLNHPDIKREVGAK